MWLLHTHGVHSISSLWFWIRPEPQSSAVSDLGEKRFEEASDSMLLSSFLPLTPPFSLLADLTSRPRSPPQPPTLPPGRPPPPTPPQERGELELAGGAVPAGTVAATGGGSGGSGGGSGGGSDEWEERERDTPLRQLEAVEGEERDGARAPRAIDNQYSFF